jgi:hypothetical protein
MLLHAERVLDVPTAPCVAVLIAGKCNAITGINTVRIDRSALEMPERCKSVLIDCGIDTEQVHLDLPHIVPEHRAWVYAHAWTIASYVIQYSKSIYDIARVLTQDAGMVHDRRVRQASRLVQRYLHFDEDCENVIVSKMASIVLECSMRGFKRTKTKSAVDSLVARLSDTHLESDQNAAK